MIRCLLAALTVIALTAACTAADEEEEGIYDYYRDTYPDSPPTTSLQREVAFHDLSAQEQKNLCAEVAQMFDRQTNALALLPQDAWPEAEGMFQAKCMQCGGPREAKAHLDTRLELTVRCTGEEPVIAPDTIAMWFYGAARWTLWAPATATGLYSEPSDEKQSACEVEALLFQSAVEEVYPQGYVPENAESTFYAKCMECEGPADTFGYVVTGPIIKAECLLATGALSLEDAIPPDAILAWIGWQRQWVAGPAAPE